MGISLEGSLLMERSKANKAMYGRDVSYLALGCDTYVLKVSARELLSGSVAPPHAAYPLYQVLSEGVRTVKYYISVLCSSPGNSAFT